MERYLRGEYGDLKDIDAYRASIFYALDRFDASFEIRAALDARRRSSSRTATCRRTRAIRWGRSRIRRSAGGSSTWLNALEYGILGIPKPDLSILLHVPADVGFDLIAQKDERAYLNGKVRDIHEDDREHLRAAEGGLSVAGHARHRGKLDMSRVCPGRETALDRRGRARSGTRSARSLSRGAGPPPVRRPIGGGLF